MSPLNSMLSAVPALLSRWGPVLAMGLGCSWFLLVAPRAIQTGEWFNLEILRARNTQDIACLLVRAASERPDLWPEPATCAELQEVFGQQLDRKRREWRCHSAVDRVLDSKQLDVLKEQTPGPGVITGYQSTAHELHAVNEAMQAMVGSAPVLKPLAPVQHHNRFAQRGGLLGLLSLAQGQEPGLTPDQARELLPPCMDAELASSALPEVDWQIEDKLSPELRAWMSSTDPPSGHVVSIVIPRCYGARGTEHLSEIDAILHVLREGNERLASCDLDWDELMAAGGEAPPGAPPPPGGGHPQGGGGHPQQGGGGHPQQGGGGHPQQGGGHPQQGGSHPQQGGSHPQQGGGGHPQHGGGGHPQQGGGGHPQHGGGGHPQGGGGHPQGGGGHQQGGEQTFGGGHPQGGGQHQGGQSP